MDINVSEVLQPFVCHGVNFKSSSGNQLVADCPLCLKEAHFYVNKATGQWDCKSCGESGNVYTFLGKWAQAMHEETDNASFEALSKERGIPAVALRAWRLGWDGTHWLLPVVSEKKTTRDIRRYDPKTGTVKSTSGCHNQLYGAYKAKTVPIGGTLWLCEGEWDTIAWSYVLGQCGYSDQRAVGVPGANIFKEEWVEHFKGRKVILCYDNDEAGRNGTKKAYEMLKGVAVSIQILQWPADKPEGYDVRDFYNHYRKLKKKDKTIFSKLSALLVSPDKVEELKDDKSAGENAIEYLENPPTFEETLTIYKKHLRMNQSMIDGLKIMFATVLSADLDGDPLWLYIVGPAGAGKTALLSSLRKSQRVVYQSSISPRSLVSGCKNDKDPSLLPQLKDKCLVWKDFTEILCLHPNDREEVYSVLRGAYDGSLRKSFGNGVIREYNNIRFSMLAGVTHAIYGQRQEALGERFLKFRLTPDVDPSEQIEAAIDNIGLDKQRDDEIQTAGYRFLQRKVNVEMLPDCPEWAKSRVISLSQIIGKLRAYVERDRYNSSLKYRPISEHGTRLAAQLIKLGKMLAFIDGKAAIDYEVYALLERVAFDTAPDFNSDVLLAIVQLQESATVERISDHAHLPRTNVRRILDDLLSVRAVLKLHGQGKPDKAANKPPDLWRLSASMERLWQRAAIGRRPVRVKVKYKGTPKRALEKP